MPAEERHLASEVVAAASSKQQAVAVRWWPDVAWETTSARIVRRSGKPEGKPSLRTAPGDSFLYTAYVVIFFTMDP